MSDLQCSLSVDHVEIIQDNCLVHTSGRDKIRRQPPLKPGASRWESCTVSTPLPSRPRRNVSLDDGAFTLVLNDVVRPGDSDEKEKNIKARILSPCRSESAAGSDKKPKQPIRKRSLTGRLPCVVSIDDDSRDSFSNAGNESNDLNSSAFCNESISESPSPVTVVDEILPTAQPVCKTVRKEARAQPPPTSNVFVPFQPIYREDPKESEQAPPPQDEVSDGHTVLCFFLSYQQQLVDDKRASYQPSFTSLAA